MFNVNVAAGSVLSKYLTKNTSLKDRNKLLLFGKINWQQSRVRVGNTTKNVRWNGATVGIGDCCCYTYMML